MRRFVPIFVTLVGVLCLGPDRARAQDDSAEVPPPRPPDYVYDDDRPPRETARRFLVEVQPYAWLPMRVRGQASVDDFASPTDVSVDELFDGQLNIASGLRIEAWATRLGFVVDGSYVRYEREGTLDGEPLDFRSQQFVGDLLAGLRLFQAGPVYGGPSAALAITGGLRAIYNAQRVAVGQAFAERNQWIAKGNVGGQLPIRFNDWFGLRARGDMRFPNIGWTVLGLVEFNAWPIGFQMGYRFDRFNYDETSLGFEVDSHSVYLGIAIQGAGRTH